MEKNIVNHRQVYYPLMGGTVNTTLCERVRNGLNDGYNVDNENVTCKFCLKILANPKHWAHIKMLQFGLERPL